MIDPYFTDDQTTVYLGKVEDVLPTLPDASVDAIVTDPPYNLPGGFMGREWDRFEHGRAFQAWCEEWAAECLRILKPGGFLLAFGGTRTWHRLVSAIEDAGFEIRDSTAALTGQDAPGLMWAHGQGFPKSHDVSKAIDKAAGAKRKVIGTAADFARDGAERSTNGDHVRPHERQGEHGFRDRWSAPVTSAATDDAVDWQGWGTALKPAWEPIAVARKPPSRTVAENVLTYGTGALNIDACRTDAGARPLRLSDRSNGNNTYGDGLHGSYAAGSTDTGRWPTNLVLTHSAACGEACAADCPVAELDRQSGTRPGFSSQRDLSTYVDRNQVYGRGIGNITPGERQGFNDSGGASRFFPVFRYEAKASTSERPKVDGVAHETVKPLDLMKFLVRLVTQPGGTVLDPFLGSGTTAEACVIEGFTCIGIEREEKYIPLIKARLDKPLQTALGFEEPA
jgi:site-specific DNA-methyltransferase (adenine-specific)